MRIKFSEFISLLNSFVGNPNTAKSNFHKLKVENFKTPEFISHLNGINAIVLF